MLLAACSSAPSPKVNLSKAEPGLQKVIEKNWFPTLNVGAVKCPTTKVRAQKGKVSTCTVRSRTSRSEFRVVQTNEQGGIAPVRYEAILSTAKAETFIRTQCGRRRDGRLRHTRRTSCARPGSSSTARSPRPTVADAEIYFRVVDPKGNIKFVRNT